MSIGNSIILFTAFFLLMETIISSKFSFLWAEIRISLNNNFSLDGKKNSSVPRKKDTSREIIPFPLLSEKMEENGIN